MTPFQKKLLASILGRLKAKQITRSEARLALLNAGIYDPKIIQVNKCAKDLIDSDRVVIFTNKGN